MCPHRTHLEQLEREGQPVFMEQICSLKSWLSEEENLIKDQLGTEHCSMKWNAKDDSYTNAMMNGSLLNFKEIFNGTYMDQC